MDVRERKSAIRAGLALAGFAAPALGLFAGVGVSLITAAPAMAETLETALARAYRANPLLNATRAGLRATDENVAQAQSGYRPTVNLSADIGLSQFQGTSSGFSRNQVTRPGGAGLTINQTLFNGFQTDNQTRRAESNVLGTRETL
ncbi:TolC family protein, partial [uncultured Methylobacterium sp.]|uniref:TolC family protein n=1 Tax=uncultured Methylobacterium sp. TaxID=157278 RepID=UPI0035CAAC6E